MGEMGAEIIIIIICACCALSFKVLSTNFKLAALFSIKVDPIF